MRIKRRMVTVELDEKTKAKLEWVAGREGKSAHAWVKTIIERALSLRPDPPAGFGIRRVHDDD